MPARGIRVVFIGLALVASACGGGDAGEATTTHDTSTSPTTGTEASTTTAADRVESLPIEFAGEESASATAEIGPDGGTLSTTADDGTNFTLTIPEGALFSTETITMTPIGSAESPLETARFLGVIMEPDGLILFEPAILEIGGADIDAEASYGFSAESSGDGLHLTPTTISEGVGVMVPHFSSVGVVNAQFAEAFTLEDLAPKGRKEAVTHDVAVLSRRIDDADARHAAIDGAISDWLIEIAIDTAFATSTADVEDLFGEFMLARTLVEELSKTSEAPLTEARQHLASTGDDLQLAMLPLFDAENLRCIQTRDPEAVFGMIRWALLIHWLATQGYGDTWREHVDRIDKALIGCATFELEFDSLADGSNDGVTFETTMTSTVPLAPDGTPSIHLLEGLFALPATEGTLEGATDIEGLKCASSTMFEVVVEMELEVRFGVLADSGITVPTVWVAFPDRPLWDCFPGGDAGGAFWHSWFAAAFADQHDGEFYDLEMVRVGEPDVFATGLGAKTLEGVTISYSARLVHTPQLP